MNEWRKVKLGDIIDKQRGISYGIVQPGPHDPNGVPIIRVNDLRNGIIDPVNIRKVNPAIAGKYKRTNLRGGEVLLSIVGTIGETLVVPKSLAGWNVARAIAVLPIDDEISPEWVNICLQSPELQTLIRDWCTTTVQPTLNLSEVTQLPIPLPPRNIRKRIIEILGRLDDKIQVNRRINRTLEAMARALYRHWFVDFGPFQDGEFVESELGLIPKGWEVRTVYSLANFINGMAFKPKDLSSDPEDGLPVIKISELNRGFPNSTTRYYGGEYKSKYELVTGDVLFAWSASLGIYLWTHGKALLNQHIFNVKSNGSLSKSVLYFLLKHVIDEFVAIAAARRTTMGHIKKSHLQEKLVAIPSAEVLRQITPQFDRIFQMILNIEIESQKLEATRDYLLPRLLSGEVLEQKI